MLNGDKMSKSTGNFLTFFVLCAWLPSMSTQRRSRGIYKGGRQISRAGQQGGVVFWLASLLAPPFICRYLPTFSLSLLTLTIEAAPEYRGMASGF
jgi:hypothetical protein